MLKFAELNQSKLPGHCGVPMANLQKEASLGFVPAPKHDDPIHKLWIPKYNQYNKNNSCNNNGIQT